MVLLSTKATTEAPKASAGPGARQGVGCHGALRVLPRNWRWELAHCCSIGGRKTPSSPACSGAIACITGITEEDAAEPSQALHSDILEEDATVASIAICVV